VHCGQSLPCIDVQDPRTNNKTRQGGIELTGGDGAMHRCHPIFASFVGNYPEQVLVSCCKSGTCPKCHISKDNLSTLGVYKQQSFTDALDILSTIDHGPFEFATACATINMQPVHHPFWQELPYTHLFQSIMPDVLHQLYQGMVKHLIKWLKTSWHSRN